MAHRQVCSVLLCVLFMSLACAAPDASPRYGLSIRAGLDLEEALQELARQTGIQFLFFSKITAGRSAPELAGEYTLNAALTRLLEGSDLTFRQVNEHTVEVRQAPPRSAELPPKAQPSTPASADQLQEVTVVAKAEQLVAMRVPTPLQEIPQSISVISQEQIRQQNSFELGDVLEYAPGVAIRRTNSLSQTAYSRGFAVSSYHVDGGSTLLQLIDGSNIYEGDSDLSEYDRVEVLRGSDALFSGNSDPGGAVSLVRKLPLPTPSFEMSATLGSWNNYRVELDATGPLTDGGALRGRADVVYATRDYFFDRAHLDRKRAFAVVQYDLTSTSTLTAGGSHQWDNALPLATPATLRSDFSDPHLPRSIGLTFPWAFYNTRIGEAYAQYRQQFADDWILKLNASAGQTIVDYGYGQFRGILSKGTQSLGSPSASFTIHPSHLNVVAADATLTGKLDWFGLRERIAIGGDFTRLRFHQTTEQYSHFGPPLTDVPNFDPGEWPDPRGTQALPFAADGRYVLEQYGEFVSLQVDVNSAWSLTGGARVASDALRLDLSELNGDALLPVFSLAWGGSHVVQPYGALMYRINSHFSWYASYADIYRSPLLPFVRSDGSSVGSQHGITFESGIKGVWREGALNGSLSVYRIEQRNAPILTEETAPVPFCCYTTGNGRSRGTELEVDGELAPGWLVGGGYTYNLYNTADGSIPNTSTPRHLLKIWTSAKLPGSFSRWTVGGGLRAQTKARGGLVVNCTSQTQHCGYDEAALVKPYAVVDLRAGYQLSPNWQVALSVNNVLDKRYFLSQDGIALDMWYGEPRNLMFRIDAKY